MLTHKIKMVNMVIIIAAKHQHVSVVIVSSNCSHTES